jgi:hypothetical protein
MAERWRVGQSGDGADPFGEGAKAGGATCLLPVQ